MSARSAGGCSTLARAVRRTILYGTMGSAGVLIAFPFFWMASTSLTTVSEATTFPPTLFPSEWHFENYVTAWQSAPFTRYFVNSAIIAGGTTLLGLLTAALAAYALARMRVPGKRWIFGILVATLMIPPEATLIPNYITIQRLHWSNKYLALIIHFAASIVDGRLFGQVAALVDEYARRVILLEGASPTSRRDS